MTDQSDDLDFAHVGPDALAGQYLRRFWHPVYRADELAPGRPVRVQALGEYFTLYREQRSDADCAGPSAGRVFMVEDRCPHRQTSLYIGWVEEDRIRCFYHGWAFDGRGQCEIGRAHV